MKSASARIATTAFLSLSICPQSFAQISAPSQPSMRSTTRALTASTTKGISALTIKATKALTAQTNASIRLASAVTSKGYLPSEVIEASWIRFDSPDHLLQAWTDAMDHDKVTDLDFMGHELGLVYVSGLGNEEGRENWLKSLLFKSEERDNWVVLSIDASSGRIAGYAIIDGANYDISPGPDNGADGESLLVKLRTYSSGAPTRPDTSPRTTPSPDYTVCKSFERAAIDKPLTILFGHTPSAKDRAADRTDGGTAIPVLVAASAGGSFALALDAAGVDTQVRSVDAVEVPYFEPRVDPVSILDEALRSLTSGQSPEMVAFRDKRRQLKADIGVLILEIDDPFVCGKANLGADAATAFAVVNWRCMSGGKLAVEHEVGHVLGLHHDDDGGAKPAFARAFMKASPNDTEPSQQSWESLKTAAGKSIAIEP